jgi:predicted GNAT family N-acyltransferase
LNNLHIERLNALHDRQSFDCGEPSLNTYIKQFARQNDQKGISLAYVLVEQDSTDILGYYTLSSASIAHQELPQHVQKKVPRYPIPSVRIGRLATDISTRGKGFGELLLFDALKRAVYLSEELAIFAVEVDALHEKAKSFYLKYGFESLEGNPHHLFLPIATIRDSL